MNISENKGIKANQAKLLEILTMFDKICLDNDIEYFLAGGTCLGAVRHEGFLPWDDDIDMYMRASVWEKSKQIIIDSLPEKYEIAFNDTDPLYNNPIIRISDKETTQYSRSRVTDNSAKGVMIEIFLLDPMPDDYDEYVEYRKNFWLYAELLSPSMTVTSENPFTYDDVEARYKELAARAEREGKDTVIKELEDKLFCYKEEDCKRFHLRWGMYWVEFQASAFIPKRVKFEDKMFLIAAYFPAILFGEYGDNWMIIPDPDNQGFHDTIENLDVSYYEYEKLLEGTLDKDAFRAAQIKNKDYKLTRYFAHRALNNYKAKHLEAMVLRNLDKEGGREKYLEVQRQLFDSYYLIKVNEDYLTDVLKDRLLIGDLRFIHKVQKIYEGNHKGIIGVFADTDRIRKIRYSYYVGLGSENMDAAFEMLEKYPDQLQLQCFVLQTKVNNGEADDSLIKETERLIDKYGQVHRLKKILADAKMSTGDVAAAVKLYEDILKSSNDGMVNLEIKHYFREGVK